MRASRLRPSAVVLAALALLSACRAETSGDRDLWRAENALHQGRHDWARIYYRRDRERHPERLSSLEGEGLAWLAGYQQSLSTGIELLDAYLAKAGPQPELERRLAAAELLLGEWERARARLARAGEGPEADLLAIEAAHGGPEAGAALARALAEAPGDARVQAKAAELAHAAGDAAAARRHAEEAVRLNPLAYPSWYLLGRLAQRAGDRAAAERAFRLHQLTSRLRHDGTLAPLPPAEALAALTELEGLLPAARETLPVLRLEVETAFAAGALDAALDALAALTTHREATADDLMVGAAQAHAAGKSTAARRAAERALELDPAHLGARASLAQLELEAGRFAEAAAAITKGLGASPHMARFHLLKARLALAQGGEGEALAELGEAVDLAPWEWTWRTELADLLLAKGERDGARQLIAEAPEEAPGLLAWKKAQNLP